MKKNRDPQASFIKLPKEDSDEICRICIKYGRFDDWGIEQLPGSIIIEPYTFSISLVNHSFTIINKIIELTKIERLLPEGMVVPKVIEEIKKDWLFSKKTGERLTYLV